MPKGSQDSLLADWSALVKEVRENEAELAGAARYRDALEKICTEAQNAKNQRDALVVSAMEATRRLNRTLADGRDAAITLRFFLRGVLGARTEKLRRYGIKPLRKRARGRRREV
jgi:hypothetical protein